MMSNDQKPTADRLRQFIELLDRVEQLHDAGTPEDIVVERVLTALLAVPRPVRAALGLRQRINVALDPFYNTVGFPRYPKLAANWDCGPTAVLDAVDHLVAASMAKDHIAILGALDELHVLVTAGLAAECTLHEAGCHGTETAA